MNNFNEAQFCQKMRQKPQRLAIIALILMAFSTQTDASAQAHLGARASSSWCAKILVKHKPIGLACYAGSYSLRGLEEVAKAAGYHKLAQEIAAYRKRMADEGDTKSAPSEKP